MGTFDNTRSRNALKGKVFADTIRAVSSTLRFGCETARKRTVKVGELRLNVLEWGIAGRPALCFLHGGSAHAHWFDLVAPAFVDRYHAIALDQRGHGESDWVTPPAYATQNFAADLLGVIDAFGWRQVALVGHSMGGHNAMSFSAWHPDRVSALVIVDSRPVIPADRLDRLRSRGQRILRPYPSAEAAAQSFRLLPRETNAEPAFFAHLGRAGVVQRDGSRNFWVAKSLAPSKSLHALTRMAMPFLRAKTVDVTESFQSNMRQGRCDHAGCNVGREMTCLLPKCS